MPAPFPDPVVHAMETIETWLPGAMFPSEIAWFLRRFIDSGADTLIECGRQDAVSTLAFGRFFQGTGVKVLSIDFDSDASRAAAARKRVEGLDVELISGDIHQHVPRLVMSLADRRVAVLQDGPKGWEGMATLLAASTHPNVRLIAQHNLHKGHVTRELFQYLALQPAFIEHLADPSSYAAIIAAERAAIARKAPNRPVDHTSLGVTEMTGAQRDAIVRSFAVLKSLYGYWNPGRVAAAWKDGRLDRVTRMRSQARYRLARFQAR